MAGRSWDGRAIDKDVPEVSSTKSLEEIQMDIGSVKTPTSFSALGRASPPIINAASKVAKQSIHIQSPTTPQASTKPMTSNGRSASPRSNRTLDEEGSATARSTPSLVSAPTRFSSRQSVASSSVRDDESLVSFSTIPSYMAPTQSAKAKARSQSTPKQRPANAEDPLSSAKKRLSFPQAEPCAAATSGPLKPTRPPGPQRSPSMKGHSGPLKFDRTLNEVIVDTSNGEFRRQFK